MGDDVIGDGVGCLYIAKCNMKGWKYCTLIVQAAEMMRLLFETTVLYCARQNKVARGVMNPFGDVDLPKNQIARQDLLPVEHCPVLATPVIVVSKFNLEASAVVNSHCNQYKAMTPQPGNVQTT